MADLSQIRQVSIAGGLEWTRSGICQKLPQTVKSGGDPPQVRGGAVDFLFNKNNQKSPPVHRKKSANFFSFLAYYFGGQESDCPQRICCGQFWSPQKILPKSLPKYCRLKKSAQKVHFKNLGVDLWRCSMQGKGLGLGLS